jgi:hypothetical protein
MQPQILIPLDNMQPKIQEFLHPAKNLSYVILPFGDAHARAYQEKIDYSYLCNFCTHKFSCTALLFF